MSPASGLRKFTAVYREGTGKSASFRLAPAGSRAARYLGGITLRRDPFADPPHGYERLAKFRQRLLERRLPDALGAELESAMRKASERNERLIERASRSRFGL